jgi:hypothetical protein
MYKISQFKDSYIKIMKKSDPGLNLSDYFNNLMKKIKKKLIVSKIYKQIYFSVWTPHQGINQQVPKRYTPQQDGKIVKMPILSGLHHHYYRRAA